MSTVVIRALQPFLKSVQILVAVVVSSLVDNIAVTVEDRILRVFLSPRDELEVGCHCENRKAIPICATSPLIYWLTR